jgi:hypothetical protein
MALTLAFTTIGNISKIKNMMMETIMVPSREKEERINMCQRALLGFKEVQGHMHVPRSFIVPTNSTDFPEDCLEMKLGINVSTIRNDNGYAEHKDELIAVGFDYESQYYTYDFIKYEDI